MSFLQALDGGTWLGTTSRVSQGYGLTAAGFNQFRAKSGPDAVVGGFGGVQNHETA